MNRWGVFAGIVLLLGGVVVVAWKMQERPKEPEPDWVAEEIIFLGKAMGCPEVAGNGRLHASRLSSLRLECVPRLTARAADAEHALRVVADEFGCPVSASAPALMVSCLKSKGHKWRAKAIKFKARWEAWVAQERAYFANLAREGQVPRTTHVPKDARE